MKDLAVYNAGVPGDTTLELLKRFNRDVAQHEPDLVLLLAGANDMFYPGHMLELDVCSRNLKALLDRISNIGAKNLTAAGSKLGFAVGDLDASDENKAFEAAKEQVMTQLRQTFRPEFLNRIDETIVFRALTEKPR